MVDKVMIKEDITFKVKNGTYITLNEGEIYDLDSEYKLYTCDNQEVEMCVISSWSDFLPMVVLKEFVIPIQYVYKDHYKEVKNINAQEELASIWNIIRNIEEQKGELQDEEAGDAKELTIPGEVIECREGIFWWDDERKKYKRVK